MTDAGDERALLHEQYAPLRRYAAVVGPGDVDPDDLVHEAMVIVLRLGQLTVHDDLGAYLRRTVLNLSAGRARKSGRGRAPAVRPEPASATTAPAHPPEVSEILRLAPRDRAALFLADVEGWSYRDLAAEFACSESAARARVDRARRRLSERLAAQAEIGHA